MNLRLASLRAMFARPDTCRLAATAALAFLLTGASLGSALAVPLDAASTPDGAAASAPAAASGSYAGGGQYTVKPGQSLNDVAIAVTQSRDRATLARAARALFDANPNAFMGHDPSRMRLGSVLTVPPLDASGAVAATAAAASAPTAGSGSASNASVAAAASGAAQGSAAAASATGAESPATQAATTTPPTAAAPTAAASAAADASSAASSDAVSSAPAAGSQAASAASGTHVWAGSVQPSASGAAAVTGASQPRAQVSSLQQLLALKNRVLMELQKHGIGGAPAAPTTASGSGTASVAGASTAAVVPGHAGAAMSTSNEPGISQTNLAVGAAVGAALVVLLAALRMGRRKRERLAEARRAEASEKAESSGDAELAASVAARGETVDADEGADVGTAAAQQAPTAAAAAAVAAAEREAAEGDAAAREMSERVAAEREAEMRTAAARDAQAREAEAQAAAQHAAAQDQAALRQAELASERERMAEDVASHDRSPEDATRDMPREATDELATARQPESHEPPAASVVPHAELPAEPRSEQDDENLQNATTAASLGAAAELGADALPRAPLEPLNEAWEPEPLSHRLEWDDEPLPPEPMEPSLPQTSAAAPQVHDDELGTPTEPRVAASTEFPRDAVDAFGSLDMPLPPRVGSGAEPMHAPESLSSQPVASPETTARQAVPPPPDADEAPHAADEIAAGTAGRGAVAGLGAGSLGTAGFGALKLDFDLELPPSPTQPLPAFTPADLARIARNKLELAAEYIELGDLAGARTLINEVIEANDPATRNDARALLSTLAPLS
ncbi:FimV/HubP family polar landmark protein [Paraburkholderia phenoliruptrix]|uniref:FimV C-terminal domain protein n=1 Tax=Burkholderia sp. (strain CCGE1003) TaxID=640512 RepID=E1TGN7_BURSG|nr:FimV/HubP family polar landmark protein [Paraburkholderia phenoliruptrix]MBW9106300.1 fimbrial protein FimV [Paraburkholderia phenoliruptrix]MBW9129373.1 fimbrial protein FimV [Paraburkholderia ginsengiterrae]